MDDHTPHTYEAGTRLSSAYTAGRKGEPFAKHFGDRTSAAYKAWKQGREEMVLEQAKAYARAVSVGMTQRKRKG